jgi:sugar/nucleoside kinase (ribokinase family)
MSQPRVVVAGHLCLDILPGLRPLTPEALRALLQPGHLLEVGPAVFTAGGAVANTGLVLHRLGIPVSLGTGRCL